MMKKMTKQIMERFGFINLYPIGNPKEPWWVNQKLNITFYNLPTTDEFLEEFINIGRKNMRDKINNSIGDLSRLLGR